LNKTMNFAPSFSLTPDFSRVRESAEAQKPFQRLSIHTRKTVETVFAAFVSFITRLKPGVNEKAKPHRNFAAQVSKPAVAPTPKSAGLENTGESADLEIRDTADWEVCATASEFRRGFGATA